MLSSAEAEGCSYAMRRALLLLLSLAVACGEALDLPPHRHTSLQGTVPARHAAPSLPRIAQVGERMEGQVQVRKRYGHAAGGEGFSHQKEGHCCL